MGGDKHQQRLWCSSTLALAAPIAGVGPGSSIGLGIGSSEQWRSQNPLAVAAIGQGSSCGSSSDRRDWRTVGWEGGAVALGGSAPSRCWMV